MLKMPKNAYFLAKIGADTAENDRNFAEFLPKTGNLEIDSAGPGKSPWRLVRHTPVHADPGRDPHPGAAGAPPPAGQVRGLRRSGRRDVPALRAAVYVFSNSELERFFLTSNFFSFF